MIPTCTLRSQIMRAGPETSNSTTSTGYKTQHLGSAQQLISVFVEVLKHVLSDAKACKTVSTISTMCHLQPENLKVREAKIKLPLMSGMDLAQCICRCTHVRWFWRTDHQALWPSIHSAFWIPFPLAMSRPCPGSIAHVFAMRAQEVAFLLFSSEVKELDVVVRGTRSVGGDW